MHRLHRISRKVKGWLRADNLPILLISIIYAVLGVYISSNVVPFHVPVLNPPEQTTDLEFGLFYPNFTGCFGQCSARGQLFVEVVISSESSPIFDNQKVSITALGSGYPPLNSSKLIEVTLEGALPYVYQPPTAIAISPPAFAGVILTPSSNCPAPRAGYGPPYFCGNSQSVYWPLPGSYFPSLTIVLGNSTTITQHLTDYRVAVYPADVLGTRQYNRITIALTVALTIFGFTEGLRTILDRRDHRKQGKLISSNPPHLSAGSQ